MQTVSFEEGTEATEGGASERPFHMHRLVECRSYFEGRTRSKRGGTKARASSAR